MTNTLSQKIFLTLGFLFFYRVLAYIPTPGVDLEMIRQFFDSNSSNALGMINMFSGNAISRLSIISLGIMPYITASIVMELLAVTVPALAEMKKDQDGMQKYMQIIRYFTIFITVVQAIGVSFGLQNMSGGAQGAVLINPAVFTVVAVFSMLTGTMLLMWIGEQITQRGIGNGISLIIFTGIVSGLPSAIGNTFRSVNAGELSFMVVLAMIAVMIITTLVIIYIELGERRVPVSYSRKTMMEKQNTRVMNYIPVKVNLSGVIPAIFASAILMLPLTLVQASESPLAQKISDLLVPGGMMFNILTFLFVIFFAFFYASIAFNAKEIANNLKRQGGFIPGVRPGEHTKEFLNEVASRLTGIGGLYLALIATVPFLLMSKMGASFYFGGVSVLIIVQVALDTMRKIESYRTMNQYQTLGNLGL